MSALSALYIVLPLPMLFLVHGLEELATQRRWMARNATLRQRFPNLLRHVAALDTKAFALVVAEEFLLLCAATALPLVSTARPAMWIWLAAFGAFALHLPVHLAQAIAVRGYTPGAITAVLYLPWAVYAFRSVLLGFSAMEVAVCTLVGAVVFGANRLLARKAAFKIGGLISSH